MNWAHLHLVVNHFPVVGLFFALLLFVYAHFRKNLELTSAVLGLFVVVALSVVPALLTGHRAEGVAEHLPGVSAELIEAHGSAAHIAQYAAGALGLAALAGLTVTLVRKSLPQAMAVGILLLAALSGAAFGWTANRGGQIRHPEVRLDFEPPPAALGHEGSGRRH
ncbi:hypothetical protein [uncultured Desulfuromonas sp.]|uniref:hypothetical protein n=1 Tax=uncultured Desulfuromonas sp. TaxID=181013 RepID=UPI002602C715|nr:hypothetical protein [uncultured Desulfuromonas sp.]